MAHIHPAKRDPTGGVLTPSDEDMSCVLDCMRGSIENAEQTATQLKQMMESLNEGTGSEDWENKKRRVKCFRHKARHLESELKYAECYQRLLGPIYAASGFQVCTNEETPEKLSDWLLDWGLIQVQPKSLSPTG
jgi:hypothetical protein